MTNKAVKLDDEIYQRLKALAEARKRTPHWMMKEAISQFVEREEEIERINQDTRERLVEYEKTGEHVEHQDVVKWLQAWGSDEELPCPLPRA